MSDSLNSKISSLCTQLQALCKKHSSIRILAIESLEQTIYKFETMVNAGRGKPEKSAKPPQRAQVHDTQLQPKGSSAQARFVQHKETVTEEEVEEAQEEVEEAEEDVPELPATETFIEYKGNNSNNNNYNNNQQQRNNNNANATPPRGLGLASLTRPDLLENYHQQQSPYYTNRAHANQSSLNYLFGGGGSEGVTRTTTTAAAYSNINSANNSNQNNINNNNVPTRQKPNLKIDVEPKILYINSENTKGKKNSNSNYMFVHGDEDDAVVSDEDNDNHNDSNNNYNVNKHFYDNQEEYGALASAVQAPVTTPTTPPTPTTPTSPGGSFARFRYSDRTPEEKALLEKKFRAQQELKAALAQQMAEKKQLQQQQQQQQQDQQSQSRSSRLRNLKQRTLQNTL